MKLENKVALVTGGGSGIGRASAELFAREGARVVVADYDATEGQAAVEAIRQSGGEAIFLEVDVSDSVQVRRMIAATVQTYGGIDILFNGAGVLSFGTVLDTDEACWNRVLAVNLTGTFLCSKYALPHIIQRGGGAIVNVSSTTGAHDANANTAAYVASKGGVTLLTRCMAIDHANENVRVNALVPGPTDTPMLRKVMPPERIEAFASTYPMRRLGRPEELARAALFLVSDDASFVTGSTMYVDGGQTAGV
jgi:meso-butanediol dehydrogenase / (S,S)-butanediol dehydrogenase / diacetyl reductase